jgi:uncharacterized protein (TIGR02246 family)
MDSVRTTEERATTEREGEQAGMSEAWEARLRRLEDRDAIHQLFSDYGHYLDRGDVDAYAELFAVDGEVLLGPMGRAKGRDNIRELMRGVLAESAGNSVHIISSPKVQLGEDVATSEAMWTVIARDRDGKPLVTMVGRHLDDLVREDGQWRIARRRGVIDIPTVMAKPKAQNG